MAAGGIRTTSSLGSGPRIAGAALPGLVADRPVVVEDRARRQERLRAGGEVEPARIVGDELERLVALERVVATKDDGDAMLRLPAARVVLPMAVSSPAWAEASWVARKVTRVKRASPSMKSAMPREAVGSVWPWSMTGKEACPTLT